MFLKYLKEYIFGKDYILKDSVCKETWYLKKGTKFSQDFIRESLIRYGSVQDYMALINLTSYGTLKRILFKSKFYNSDWEKLHNFDRYNNIFIFLDYKFNRINLFQKILFYLLFGGPCNRNYYQFKVRKILYKKYLIIKEKYVKKFIFIFKK